MQYILEENHSYKHVSTYAIYYVESAKICHHSKRKPLQFSEPQRHSTCSSSLAPSSFTDPVMRQNVHISILLKALFNNFSL